MAVIRVALPSFMAVFHKSPSKEKTMVSPSGLIAGLDKK
jgi:hypothetical protein